MSKFNSSVILSTGQECYRISIILFKHNSSYDKKQFKEKINDKKENIFSILNKKHPDVDFTTIFSLFVKSCYLYYKTLSLTDSDYINPHIAKNLIDSAWLSWSIPYSKGGLDRGGAKPVKTNRATFAKLLNDIEKLIFCNESKISEDTSKNINLVRNKTSKKLENKLKDDIETKDRRILILENQIEEQKIILDNIFRESEEFKNEIKVIKEVNLSLDNKITSLNNKCDCLKKEKHTLETNRAELLHENSKLLEDYEYYKSCTITSQEKINEVLEINSFLSGENEELKLKSSKIEARVNELQNEYNKLKLLSEKNITKTINKNNSWFHIKFDKDFGDLSLKKFFLLLTVMSFSILIYIFEINFFSLFSLNISF